MTSVHVDDLLFSVILHLNSSFKSLGYEIPSKTAPHSDRYIQSFNSGKTALRFKVVFFVARSETSIPCTPMSLSILYVNPNNFCMANCLTRIITGIGGAVLDC